MATSLQIYESQVINFLKSCTIIFSPIATQQNVVLVNSGYVVDETDSASWKYYLNLSGQYHPSDTVMTIQSLDTKTTVNFTTDMLASSPKTAAAYVIGSSYYNALCQSYPTQVDLIKSILYPVDLQTAVNSQDFTFLGWGNGYLESDEQEAIVYEINNFLEYASSSWYFSFLSYECYYDWTFWASLWQVLSNVIFAARIKYLHTSYVHSFHIWAYLQSRGISDYSDILTRQQALFLYRNIEYLIENRGTQSNLVILVNNLLTSISVGLVGKTIYMNTLTNAATCQWVPEFVSKIVPTNDSQSLVIIPPESMTQINSELVLADFEVNNSEPYILEQQTFIGNTPLNILQTKLVEIQKLGIDQKYGSVLNNFILDTLVSMIVTGRYTPELDITDPTTNIIISLGANDALALYYYAVHRSGMEQPIDLPVLYTPSCAFRYDVTENSFPEEFNFDGFKYPTSSYLSISDIITGISYPALPINNTQEFSDLVSNLFLVLIKNIRYSRTEGDYVALKMFDTYMKDYVLQTTPYTFSLSENTDYISWAKNLNLTTLLDKLDATSDYQTAYSNLATAITTSLVPFDTTVFGFFGYTPESVNNVYDRLKALFLQLCSYNIAFLDTDRTNTWWFLTERILTWVNDIRSSVSIPCNPCTGMPTVYQQDKDYISIDTSKHEVEVTVTGNIVQNLIENDIVKIGMNNDTLTIPNHVSIATKPQTETNFIIFANPITLKTIIYPATTP